MNLSIALGADALPEDEEPLPEKRKQRWGGALTPRKRTNDFAHLYQHEKPFKPDWADKEPGSTPKLPLKPPGGRP